MLTCTMRTWEQILLTINQFLLCEALQLVLPIVSD
jgi:hypothetical protein